MPRKAAKRELLEPHKGDKRYGKFSPWQDEVRKSLSQDRRRKARTVVKQAKATEVIPSPESLLQVRNARTMDLRALRDEA
jgi:hypothetical protein